MDDYYGLSSAELELWKQKRRDFNSLKKTPEFSRWKSEQYKCQHGRCAWCQGYIPSSGRNVHVDHVQPLYHGGTNDFSNLVLSCRSCNKRKGASIYNEELYAKERGELSAIDLIKGTDVEKHYWKMPSWIEPNKYVNPNSYTYDDIKRNVWDRPYGTEKITRVKASAPKTTALNSLSDFLEEYMVAIIIFIIVALFLIFHFCINNQRPSSNHEPNRGSSYSNSCEGEFLYRDSNGACEIDDDAVIRNLEDEQEREREEEYQDYLNDMREIEECLASGGSYEECGY